MYSKAHARQPWMVLDLMNPYWFLRTSGITTDCNLSPRSLVMTLTAQLIREIGLKSFILEGVFTFGTNVMKDVFIDCTPIFPSKKSMQS
jgi:hypothetical protein